MYGDGLTVPCALVGNSRSLSSSLLCRYSFEALDPLFDAVDSLLSADPSAFFKVLYSSRGKKLDDHLPEAARKHGFQYSLAFHQPNRADMEPMRLCTFSRVQPS